MSGKSQLFISNCPLFCRVMSFRRHLDGIDYDCVLQSEEGARVQYAIFVHHNPGGAVPWLSCITCPIAAPGTSLHGRVRRHMASLNGMTGRVDSPFRDVLTGDGAVTPPDGEIQQELASPQITAGIIETDSNYGQQRT